MAARGARARPEKDAMTGQSNNDGLHAEEVQMRESWAGVQSCDHELLQVRYSESDDDSNERWINAGYFSTQVGDLLDQLVVSQV